MSIWDIHYDALYASPIAVDAVLTVACGDPPMKLRAIDKTAGQILGFKGVDVATIQPSATVRVTELSEKGVSPADLDGAVLALNGKDWKVISHEPLPAPTGEAKGEMMLTLDDVRNG